MIVAQSVASQRVVVEECLKYAPASNCFAIF
jgi:hypothetical protein